MNSESESPPDDAETAHEDADSDDAGIEIPSVGESPAETTGAIDRFASTLLVHWRPILLTASVIAAVGLAACLFALQYRPDRQIDDAAARRAIQGASDGAVATLSYSSESIDRDFARARSHLTGEFLAYYDKFTKDIVMPTVKEKHLVQTAAVLRAAVSELHPDSAVVLVFLNETTASKEKREPLTTPSSVRITLTKVHGSWLISKLDPYG
ncbi:MAG: Mce-associated rane protein [Mycobacterium sp.]|jgi:Mce-associated membrane protein|nr:Mce-associated rane protein [Mycobacterium sp.]MDT5254409.1 Mce-associated rane protein [Mycobacterium sp.]MDT5310842.1 Mce-associated rane protein [Mycobacterium sp.]MDT7767464.1 Mce-associated rane protein [Mycobacterium sp.]